MKSEIIIGFREKPEIVSEIDRLADEEGCDRSSFIRRLIREKLHLTE